MVEEFPKSQISLSYSDGSYTRKRPPATPRQKRQTSLDANAASTTPAPRPYRNTISPLSMLPLQFSIYGSLLLFSNG